MSSEQLQQRYVDLAAGMAAMLMRLKVLEEFSAWVPPQSALCLARADLGLSDSLRYFAAQAAVAAIRGRWTVLSDAEKVQLQAAALETLSTVRTLF